jgi:hypothetical protein
MKTITFGCAQIRKDWAPVRPELHGYLEHVRGKFTDRDDVSDRIGEINQAYIHAASEEYGVYRDDSFKPDWGYCEELRTPPERLRRLENVHVVIKDDADFLGGWLTPDQASFIKF